MSNIHFFTEVDLLNQQQANEAFGSLSREEDRSHIESIDKFQSPYVRNPNHTFDFGVLGYGIQIFSGPKTKLIIIGQNRFEVLRFQDFCCKTISYIFIMILFTNPRDRLNKNIKLNCYA